MENKKTILLVEDEALIAMSGKMTLEQLGYKTVVAHTGEKAVELAANGHSIDLILMDIDLGPGIDGTEAAGIILEEQDIPVVFLSSHTERETVAKTEKITSYGYVVKNSGGTVLDASIKMAFRLFEARQAETRINKELSTTLEELRAVTEELTCSEEELLKRERDLRESDERFRSMLNLVPDMISIHDTDMNILYSNWNGFADVPPAKRRIHTKCYRTYRDMDQICPDCQARHVIETGEPLAMESELPDGRWVDLRVFPLRDGDGRITMFAEWVRDITAQKNTEKSLQDREKWFSTLVENAPDIIARFDRELRHMYINRAIEKHTGIPPREFIGKTNEDLGMPNDQVQLWNSNLREAFRGKQEVEMHFSFPHAAGEKTFQSRLVPESVTSGDVETVMAITREITAQRTAEDELGRQLSEKETLLKEVHHRIKNNMASVEGLLSVQARKTESEEAAAVLRQAVSRVQSIRSVYDTLLIEREHEKVSVRRYIEQLVDAVRTACSDSSSVTIETRIDDFTLSARKAVPVGIVVNELLTNVFKYAFAGRDSGHILIALERTGEQVKLIIADDGIGSEPIRGAKKSQGFGLEIVRMLAEQLQGTFSTESGTGTRSVLEFTIPQQ